MIIKIIVACCCLFFLFFPTCSHGADLSISSAKNTPACIRSAVHRIGRDVTRIRARDINCQNPGVVDSLKAALQQNLAWRDQYHLLHKLAAEYFDTDNQKAFDFVLEAEQAALASGDSLLIVRSKRLKGQILFKLGRIEDVLNTTVSAYTIAERLNFTDERMLIMNILGCVYLYESRLDKALDWFFQLYGIATRSRDTVKLTMSLENIGITYYKLRNYKAALDYLSRSFDFRKRTGAMEFATPMNISLCYVQMKDFHNAERFLSESRRICGVNCSDLAMMHIKYASGCILRGLGHHDSAKMEFLASYNFAMIQGGIRMKLDNICMLSDISMTQNHIGEALAYLKEGEAIVDKEVPFNLESSKIYSRLSDLFFSIGDFERTAIYQRKYIAWNDSVLKQTANLMKLESEFLEQENLVRIAAQDEAIVLKEEVIYHQKLLILAAGLLGIAILTLVGLLHRQYMRKKSLNAILEHRVKERTQELEQNRNILLRSIREKEIEISRIINSIAVSLRTLEGLCLNGSNDLPQPAAQVYFLKIRQTIAGLRRRFKV